VVTAMITPSAVPAPLHPGHLPASTPPVIIRKDFADPLAGPRCQEHDDPDQTALSAADECGS